MVAKGRPSFLWKLYLYKSYVWIFIPDCRREKTDMKLKILL